MWRRQRRDEPPPPPLINLGLTPRADSARSKNSSRLTASREAEVAIAARFPTSALSISAPKRASAATDSSIRSGERVPVRSTPRPKPVTSTQRPISSVPSVTSNRIELVPMSTTPTLTGGRPIPGSSPLPAHRARCNPGARSNPARARRLGYHRRPGCGRSGREGT